MKLVKSIFYYITRCTTINYEIDFVNNIIFFKHIKSTRLINKKEIETNDLIIFVVICSIKIVMTSLPKIVSSTPFSHLFFIFNNNLNFKLLK